MFQTIKIVALLLILSVFGFGKTSIYTTIPSKAHSLIPIVYDNVDIVMPDFELDSYFLALIEQESCISLTHSKCFSPNSRLYAKRKNGSIEEGIGFFQLTRVYRPSGKLRFDTLTGLVRKYPTQLRGLSWSTVRKRPDLQIRAAILLWNDNYKRIKRNYGKGMLEFDLIAFADAAYNGGYGDLRKEIRKCRQKKGCNSKVWFGNVEHSRVKSRRILYGKRDAHMINRHHVRTILYKRFLKYHYLNLRKDKHVYELHRPR